MRKIIVAGSRTITDWFEVNRTILFGLTELVDLKDFNDIEIVSGRARGIDILGERYAKENNLKLKLFPADWDQYGKRAGYLRNKQMAEYADSLILIWDGKSRGSQMMLELAKQYNLKIYEKII